MSVFYASSIFEGIRRLYYSAIPFPALNFKIDQLQALSHILNGKDLVGVLPTGFGKSVIFQLMPFILPTKARRNILIVVSPLTSIMLDQKAFLEKRGIKFGVI